MKHVVALVPGFLGFDHHGGVTYFADRFIASLRAAIEAMRMPSTAVVPVTVPPIGSLAERQTALLTELHALDGRFDCRTLHLVGHSTGGLDASLLTRKVRLTYTDGAGSAYSDNPFSEEDTALLGKLRSVTTLATPHYGTTLTRAPLPAMAKPGPLTVHDKIEALRAIPGLTRDIIFQRDAIGERLSFGEGAVPAHNAVDFFWHLLHANKLARDLDPDIAGALSGVGNLGTVPVLSIATITPAPPATIAAGEDRLFRDLWTWTAQHASDVTPTPRGAADGFERIASNPTALPKSLSDIGEEANDGVVNTRRQVFGKLTGIVLADHGDVIGRYRRRDVLDDELLDPGLLTSGAEFGDDQFFALIRLVAKGIVGAL